VQLVLTPDLTKRLFDEGLLPEPLPLDVAMQLMSQGYILEKLTKEDFE